MKLAKIFSIIAAAMLAASCSPGGPTFRAGAAAVDVTPKVWPLPLIGNFDFRPAESAHDPLHVRAMVLDDGATRLAIAVVDSCYVQREVLDEAKRRAAEAADIPAERMLISATHTHSAPPAMAGQGTRGDMTMDLSENERLYQEQLTAGIAEAVTLAAGRLEPAEIGWGTGRLEDEVHNRRWYMKPGTIPPDPFGGTTDQVQMNPPRASENLVRPAGETDPVVSVVSVRSLDGQALALLANYSLHYVGGIPPGQVSADYFGEFARVVSERVPNPGPNFTAILSNGTSGDVNNINFTAPAERREPFEQIRKVSGKTADVALGVLDGIEYRSDLTLAMAESELDLAPRKPTQEGYERAKEVLLVQDESTLPRRAKAYAQRAIDLYEGPDTVRVKLQAVRIGELGIAALPFETFVEIGKALKGGSPFSTTFTIELANGANGYLPTPEQHAVGGYETWMGTNKVEKEASVKITARLLELLTAVAEP